MEPIIRLLNTLRGFGIDLDDYLPITHLPSRVRSKLELCERKHLVFNADQEKAEKLSQLIWAPSGSLGIQGILMDPMDPWDS